MKLLLLEKKDADQIKLFHLLQSRRTDQLIQLSLIAKKLNVDLRTARKRVELLEHEIQSVDALKDFRISINKSSDVIFTIPPFFSEDILVAFYSKRCLMFNLVYDILLNHFTSIEQFAADHFVSVTTVYQKIPQLQDLLATLKLSLDLNSKSKFSGPERRIRQFYYYLLFNIVDHLEFDFLETPELPKLNVTISKLWLNILYYRLAGDHYATTVDPVDDVKSYFYSKDEFLSIYQKDIHLIFQGISLEDDLLDCEIHSLFVTASCWITIFLPYDQVATHPFHIPNVSEQTQFEKMTLQWIESFKDFFHINLKDSEINYVKGHKKMLVLGH